MKEIENNHSPHCEVGNPEEMLKLVEKRWRDVGLVSKCQPTNVLVQTRQTPPPLGAQG